MAKSGITREEIISWGGAEAFNQGLAFCNTGDVTEIKYDEASRSVSGKIIQSDGWAMPVGFSLKEKGRIESHCPCYANRKLGQVCPHVTALAIALSVMEMDDEPEERVEHAGESGKTGAGEPQEEREFIEVPMKPSFYAFVQGSRASLSIAVDAWYGDIDFPACSIQAERTVWIPDPDDPSVRRTRSAKTEREALEGLEEWGFARGYSEGDLRLYITDPRNVLNFLGGGVPALRRMGWKIDFADKLSGLVDSFSAVVPVVKVKDAPSGAFDVHYSFELAGGGEVSDLEVQVALNRRESFILKNGRVALLDAKAIETMHGIFSDCASSQDGAAAGWFRVRGIHAPYVKSSLDSIADVVEVEDFEAPEWRSSASLFNREAKFEAISLGDLEGTLRPYQRDGVYWMRFLENAGLGGLLADEMGLGKTLQTLAWLSLAPAGGAKGLPNLIVCPTSLVRNWEAEAKKFTPGMNVLVVSGPDRAKCFPAIASADLVVTSYALLQRDFEDAYLGREFDAVVIDEAQHVKNRDTKNAKAVKSLLSRRRLALTGTPVENSVADVWSIFEFILPGLGYLGESYEDFKLKYEQPIADGGSAGDEALERLRKKLEPFILRRVKKTVAKDLPDKITKISYCPMDDDTQREYNAALAKVRVEAKDAIKAKGFQKSRFELLALLMKLRQIASLGKLPAFMEQLEAAISGGHKILVFSQFVKMLKIIAGELEESGIPYCYLDGSTKDRLGECNRFNRDPSIPVFLISLMAGGTGLNLTGADMVIHYDPWWNPAVEDQATDRAHRIGQKKSVYVMKMIASGSVEEKVLALQRRKQAVIAATVGTTDAAVMEKLTAEDLSALLS